MRNSEPLSRKINSAIEYVKNQKLNIIPVGKYTIDDDSYFTLQEYETKDESLCKFESHKQFVDVHLIINGEEKINVCSLDLLTIETPYDDNNDTIIWGSSKFAKHKCAEVILNCGSYVVLYPDNAHMPAVKVNGASKIRKVVIKVKI